MSYILISGYNLQMSLKTFLMKKLLRSKMKGVPEADQDKILNAIEKNPKLFQYIATEVQALVKSGKDQMSATMEVMQKHSTELKDLI